MNELPDISRRPYRLMARHTLVFLVFFYLAAVFAGLSVLQLRSPSLLGELVSFFVAFCLAVWALEDDRRRRSRIPLLSRPWFLVFAGVLVPGYVVWSRGWRGVGWVALHAFGYFAVAMIAYVVGMLVFLRR